MRWLRFLLAILAACQGTPEPAVAKKPLRDFRGIIHCHSKYSHDSQGTYEEILAAAKAAKVDFICMTDHPPSDDKGRPLREGWTGLHDGVLFIQGAEYSDQLLGLGLKEPLESGLDRRAKIKAIHAQGGLAIACHPEEIKDWSEYDEADGMEIYNVHAMFKQKTKDKGFLLQIAKKMKEDPERSFELLQELDPAVLKKWDEIGRKRRFTGIAGNDSHQNVSLFGYRLDPYPRAFRFVSTHVLAEELTQEAILGALKKGNAYVAFDLSRPIRLGVQESPPDREGVISRIAHNGDEVRELNGTGRVESLLPQRIEWWLPAEKGRIPWVLFPYSGAGRVAHWP